MLVNAVRKGNIDLVKDLVIKKVDLNKKNDKENTPLIEACERGDYKIAKYLVENGARIDLKNSEERTALMIARGKGYTEIVSLLESIENNNYNSEWNPS